MKNTIKLKIQIAIAIIIAVVSGVQAWISVSQLRQETTSALNSEMENVSQATARYISDWLAIRSDMMLANEKVILDSSDADREMLVTKRGRLTNAKGDVICFSGVNDKVLHHLTIRVKLAFSRTVFNGII